MMLNWFAPDLGGKVSSLSPLNIITAVGFLVDVHY